MRGKLTRREFLRSSLMAALGAGLMSCAGLPRRIEITPAPSLAFTPAPTPIPKHHEALYYSQLDGNRVQCQMCFRRCIVAEGERGFCRNKVNVGGRYLTRFFPAYKLTGLPSTPVETLESAARIADEEGLQYVYIGNLPGHKRNSTYCPKCGEPLIVRIHFTVFTRKVEKGKCPSCGHRIPGVWRDA